MASDFQSDEFPELIFGLVAPIGVKIDVVIHSLEEALTAVAYKPLSFKITTLMQEIPSTIILDSKETITSYKQRIKYANDLCRRFGVDLMAQIAISAIRSSRLDYWKDLLKNDPAIVGNDKLDDDDLSNRPVPGRAYIIRQLKRPEEIELLRKVYGRQFVVVSTYAPEDIRIANLESSQRKSLGGLADVIDINADAVKLVGQDSKENKSSENTSGQNVRDAFPLGDVFIDGTSKKSSDETVRRFIHLLFGNNHISPTKDEYGMYLAKSASLRSSDLSRQVGAAIFTEGGEVKTLGCNEVPKAGGGTYWTSDLDDQRDFQIGADPNDEQKNEILIDLINRLMKQNSLSAEFQALDPLKVTARLLENKTEQGVADSRLMDLLEFGRIIHAEMSAISDAARKGISIKDTTIFCTTFPCHICAKHIVAAGIKRVVYLEPYTKSYASKLHADSISLGPDPTGKKVGFEPFIGVSPFRYRDLFEKGKRKYRGEALEWNQGKSRPQFDSYFPSYHRAEALVVTHMKQRVQNNMTTPP